MSHIAIVRVGIAGLTAALTLQDAGLACTIYEASNRIGDRIHSDILTWGMEWSASGVGDSLTLSMPPCTS